MTDLPPGWEWSTFGEVAQLSLGKMLDKKQATGAHPTPYLRNINVRWGGFDLTDVASMDIRPEELDRVEARPGDVVACEGGEPGRAAVWQGPEPIALQKALHRIRPVGGVSGRYLAHGLAWLAFSQRLSSHFTGSTIKHLPKERLRAIAIPVPPVREQERVLSTIEELLPRVEEAERAVVAAGVRLDRLRASLLGSLTEGAFESRPLADVLLSLRNGCFVSRPSASPPGLPIFRISAVRPLALNVTDVRFAPVSLEKAADYSVSSGDLLFTRYSGTPDFVAACAVVPPAGAGILHPDKLIRGVPRTDLVDARWVAMAMSSVRGRHHVERRLKTTAGQVGISGAQLKTVPIPVPPLPVQMKRVARWESASTITDRLVADLEVATARAAALRRSILDAAFSGKLVPQDPDDEPASVLLERIRAERDAAGPRRRARS